MHYFLGIDVSTTASKAVVIDELGAVVASHSVLHASFSVPEQPLWSEQNPENWWLATSTAIKTVLNTVPASNIKCVSLTGQMQGLVVLDKDHKPLRPAILWNDQRSSEECEAIEQQLGKDFLCQHIGSKILPCHLLPKLMWIKNHQPKIYEQIAHIITPKDYVRFCLSGVLAVDESDASGFALMNVAKREWSTHIITNQKIPLSWLPKIHPSTSLCADVNAEGARATNLPIGLPIAAGAGDQPAQSIGCGMVDPGAMSLQIGTSGVVTQIGNYAPAADGAYLDYCHAQSKRWIAMGLTASAAGSFEWFRKNIAQDKSFAELDAMASMVARGSEGLIFIPDICGNIHPYANALARGHFIGLTKQHTLAHMARAVLEGVAFSMREIAEIMCSKSKFSPDSYKISGGAAKSALWKMIFAEIMQKPLHTVNTNEGAAYGAAIIGGVAVGFWPNLESACNKLIKNSETIEPSQEGIQEYQDMYSIWRQVYPRLQSINTQLASLKKKDRKSIVVFIGGASGSGKTTLAELLEAKLLEQGKTCATIKMDDYFHEIPDNMDLKKYQNETIFDTPDMLYLEELRQHLLNLSKGQTIAKPIFDFSTSRRNGTKNIASSDIIIVEGIFALEFVQKWLRSSELFTLTVNVEASSYLDIVKRRIQRNTRDYHQDKDWLIQQEKKSVGPGFFKHTAAGALYADISLLNDTTTQENGTINPDALNAGVSAIINQLNQINTSSVPLARKPPPDVKQMVINSHSEDGQTVLLFRK